MSSCASRGLLLQGIPEQETRVTCTACAGTLLLEFGLLSRLTENPVFEEKARHAAVQVFSKPPTMKFAMDAAWCNAVQLTADISDHV